MKAITLLYGDTRSNSDMLYLGGIHIHDPFFCFESNGKAYALLNPLEIGRARKSSKFDGIFDSHRILDSLPQRRRLSGDDCDAVCALLKSEFKARRLRLAYNFPLYYADRLSEAGFDLEILPPGELLFPRREVKSKWEEKQIRRANVAAEAAFFMVEEMLRRSKISGGKILFDGEILTSEMLICEIEKTAIAFGADAMDTIAASGAQACDPHCAGHGPIAPNSLIVVDIFPRMRDSGYYGDMTRTFLKGIPSEAQMNLVETVKEAQQAAISNLKAGVDAASVHSKVCEFFDGRGYKTGHTAKGYFGFFHSTGHGVGLDIHETPRIGRANVKLESGNVVTVEPGLYYPEIGGCRIEDTVMLCKKSAKLLSNYHYEWIIE